MSSGGRKVSTLPRNRDNRDTRDSSEDSLRGQGEDTGSQVTRWHSLESVGDITADTSMDYIEFSSQTLPRSYKAEVIKSEWAELMESSSAALAEADMFHTLPRYAGRVKQVLTVQEKLEDAEARPPPAELYVNLLDEDEDAEAGESEADTASMSTGTVSHRPTPHVTPHHSFSGADKTRPIDIAKMLDPFEALEREFGWEGGVTIRPPSAFCSLADIQEDSDEKFGDTDTENPVSSDPVKRSEISEVMEAVDEAVNSLDDSGVCDVSDVSISEERDAGQDVR